MHNGVTIYFVRHGETDWNAEQRFQGKADVPLNDKGRAQARRNGEALRILMPAIATVDFISSPSERARETMQIMRTALGLSRDDFTLDERLMEVDYGDWTGTLLADLERSVPDAIAERTRSPYHWRPPGGETYAELMERASAWLSSVERDTVVASHGGVSRVLRGKIYGIDPTTTPTLPVPQDQVLVLRREGMTWL